MFQCFGHDFLFHLYYSTRVMTSRFKLLFIITALFVLSACSDKTYSDPSCRIKTSAISSYKGSGTCIIRLQDKLLVVQYSDANYGLAKTHDINKDSAQCTAHRALWQQTGFNAEVQRALGITTDGTWLFKCEIDSGYTGEERPFPPAPWSANEISSIQFIDPFEIPINMWRNPDELIVVRDAFVASKDEQK